MSERGSDQIRAETAAADAWLASRVAYVETLGVIGRTHGLDSAPAREFGADWSSVLVAELTPEVADLAVELVLGDQLRSLDGLHLASALDFGVDGTAFATWDRRLWQAAERRGFQMLPAEL